MSIQKKKLRFAPVLPSRKIRAHKKPDAFTKPSAGAEYPGAELRALARVSTPHLNTLRSSAFRPNKSAFNTLRPGISRPNKLTPNKLTPNKLALTKQRPGAPSLNKQRSNTQASPTGRIQQQAQKLLAWWQRTLIARILKRFAERRGGLLAAGLAYGLLFAFFAAVWTLFSIAGLIVSNSDLLKRLVEGINRIIPASTNTLLNPKTLTSISVTLTWTGIVTLLMFFWTVLGWMNSLRDAVQAMFDGDHDSVDLIQAKLRDALAVILVVVLFVLSTVAGAVSGGVLSAVLQALQLNHNAFLTSLLFNVLGFCIGFVLNALLFFLLFKVVAHVKAGRFLFMGCALGALAVSIMQLLGGQLLTGASKNPLLAPFAAVIGVLIWFNLMSMVIMFCSAFIAECRKPHTIEASH